MSSCDSVSSPKYSQDRPSRNEIGNVYHDDITPARGDHDDNNHHDNQTKLVTNDDGHDKLDHDKMVSTMMHTSSLGPGQHCQKNKSIARYCISICKSDP